MKKVISFIIATTIFLSFMPVYADNSVSSVDYPAEGAELGYLFSLKAKPTTYFNIADYDGIELASAMANIYYSDTIEHIKDIENIVDIDMVVENWALDIPNPTFEPMYDDTAVSLFSLENDSDIDKTENITAYADEALYPNDPLLERQWYYDAVKAQSFRDNNIDGTGIRVGIIDSGLTKEFKTFHDFEGVDIQTGINICAKLDKNEELLYDTSDNQTHGTSVASVICSKANNTHGIAGLTDGCTVIPYKVEDSRCSTFANSGYTMIVAIDMAYQDGCDVLNISRGGTETPQYQKDMENAVINKAIQNGMIIVAAVGNDGRTTNAISYPAACDNVIGVSSVEPTCDRVSAAIDAITEEVKPKNEATAEDGTFRGWLRSTVQNLPDNAYTKTSSSTANESVFVCASGTGITTADPIDASSWTDKISSFSENSGTSFATPIVTSAAIGVKQMRPYVDTDMFKEILKNTVVDLDDEGYDINTGYGMVNFKRIYDYVSQMPLTAPERPPEVTIDYKSEQLVGFPINREYTVNGEALTLNDDFSLPIKEEWFGNTISIVKKASSESYEDSLPQELVIPARPAPPKIEILEDYSVKNIGSDIWYKEENAEYWKSGYDVEDYTITLERGKTYVFKVQYTENSFASKERQITVQFADTAQYYIETSIVYDHDRRECTYSAVNNTIWTINAVGIIAVYAQNGGLKHLETVSVIPAEGINKKLNFALTDGDTVKWLVWDSLESMKPKEKVKLSEYNIKLKEATNT